MIITSAADPKPYSKFMPDIYNTDLQCFMYI